MIQTISIEETIWDINTKQPIRTCVLKNDGKKITRELFVLGDRRNGRIDVVDSLNLSVEEIINLPLDEIGSLLKSRVANCLELNFQGELPFFAYLIITKE